MSVPTIKNTIPWVLSYRIPMWYKLCLIPRNPIILSCKSLLRAIWWTIRPILFPADDLCLLLWYQRCARIHLLLSYLLHLSNNILMLLLKFCVFHLVSVQRLYVLKSLLRLLAFDAALSSSMCTWCVVGDSWRRSDMRWSTASILRYWSLVLGLPSLIQYFAQVVIWNIWGFFILSLDICWL